MNIETLEALVKERLSEKRFKHTLAVRDMALRLGKIFLPDKLYELEAATLLHDITKEVGIEENIALMGDLWNTLSDEERQSPQIFHAYSAPVLIKREFKEFAKEDILSAVFKHTVADEDMSIFDMIIFLSDFIEQSRVYEASIKTREYLFGALCDDATSNITALIKASIMEIDFTIEHIKKKGGVVVPKTLLARTGLFEKIR